MSATSSDNDAGSETATPKYRDKETLQELYIEKGLSTFEIAEKFGCHQTTVSRWLSRHDIEARKPDHKKDGHLNWTRRGYLRFQTKVDGEIKSVYIHRLVAISKFGISPVLEKDVHHRNGVKFDNRPENLELLDRSSHARLHAKGGSK
jgi:hypothetical protein